MSHFLDRLRYFRKTRTPFAGGHGEVRDETREWENGYRARWQHDKIVRSTHGVNCTGSCSWQIYVKNGLVTWETQQTDYPRTRPDLPNHEPRGCPRGASYSWYLYSANRLKYPLVRKTLIELWREALARHGDPVEAWASIVEDPAKAKQYKQTRGMGGFVRAEWDEMETLVAASNVYTAKQYGPDRVVGFSPIPAMSMVSYASGARYLSLIGGVCLSFYDWYCDLPPASPMTWGEQTDVPESADWYNSNYIIAWGSNVPQTRTPDAHFFTEVRYKGNKTVAITPDYAEVAKLCDEWLSPKQGTDAALAMALGHVILKEFHLDKPSAYFTDYVRRYTDMPMLVELETREDGSFTPGKQLRAADFDADLGEENNPEWKTIAWDELGDRLVVHAGDALAFGFGALQEADRPLRIVGNLPYNISTPLMFHLLAQSDCIEDMHFMLQKEVVLRLAATAGMNHYGRLGIMVQYHCRVEHLFDVGPGAFNPAPKVDSAIVRLVPHATLPHPADDVEVLEILVRDAFNQRRKTLRNTLKALLSAEEIEAEGIDPGTRPEQVDLAGFVRLANRLARKRSASA